VELIFAGLRAVFVPDGIGRSRTDLLSKIFSKNGGKVETKLSPNVTHVVTILEESGVQKALKCETIPVSINIIKPEWISKSVSSNRRLAENSFSTRANHVPAFPIRSTDEHIEPVPSATGHPSTPTIRERPNEDSADLVLPLKKAKKEHSIENSSFGKLRILILHSEDSCVDTFKKHAQELCATLKEIADLEFVNAPHKVSDVPEKRKWFFLDEKDNWAHQVDQSLTLLQEFSVTNGRLDGVLGYSHGATIASLLCADKETFPSLKFAVLFSGRKCPPYKQKGDPYKERIICPSLHIWGTSDWNTHAHKSRELAEAFDEAIQHEQQGGSHFMIYQNAEKMKTLVRNFILPFYYQNKST